MATLLGSAWSSKYRKRAQNQLKKAQGEKRKIAVLRSLTARRTFLRNFRSAQADALSGAVASGAGIDSSLALGQAASQQTQRNTALSEDSDIRAMNVKVQSFSDQAQNELDNAADAQFAGDVFQTALEKGASMGAAGG
jgi:predicted PP-loop superfamily ATPase